MALYVGLQTKASPSYKHNNTNSLCPLLHYKFHSMVSTLGCKYKDPVLSQHSVAAAELGAQYLHSATECNEALCFHSALSVVSKLRSPVRSTDLQIGRNCRAGAFCSLLWQDADVVAKCSLLVKLLQPLACC